MGAVAKLYRTAEHTQNPEQTHNNTYHEQVSTRNQRETGLHGQNRRGHVSACTEGEKIKTEKPEIINTIQSSGKLDEDTENLLSQIIEEFKKSEK